MHTKYILGKNLLSSQNFQVFFELAYTVYGDYFTLNYYTQLPISKNIQKEENVTHILDFTTKSIKDGHVVQY